jgi:DNA-binding IclR family transcriptional regulator
MSGEKERIDAPRRARGTVTSIEKAFEVCEALSTWPGGISLSELSRTLRQPRPTVHRLLSLLKRRGYVRQDEETQRYSLGRSELRLHAYPCLRDYRLGPGQRGFVAIPSAGEVTYIWNAGSGEAGMRTVYGKEMPAHCSIYLEQSSGSRRLSCLRLSRSADVTNPEALVARFGSREAEAEAPQRMYCTCAPVHDYAGREVARIGVFGHGHDDRPILSEHHRGAWDLARHVSMRLGHLALESPGGTA